MLENLHRRRFAAAMYPAVSVKSITSSPNLMLPNGRTIGSNKTSCTTPTNYKHHILNDVQHRRSQPTFWKAGDEFDAEAINSPAPPMLCPTPCIAVTVEGISIQSIASLISWGRNFSLSPSENSNQQPTRACGGKPTYQ